MTDGRRAGAGQIDPRLRGRRTHLCAACDFPIAVYGRCAPCLHAYCLTCAASMPQCLICRAFITKLERIPADQGLLISPLTLQAYRSEADLARHVQQLQGTLEALAAGPAPTAATRGGGGAAAGWKPPPPPGGPPPPPPGGPAAYGRRTQQQQQQQQQYGGQSWQGAGAVMVPR